MRGTGTDRPLRDCPEAFVVAQAQNGDREAFGELVRRNDRQLKGLAYSMTSNPTVVDDIVGESFLKALANLDQYVAKAKFSSWIGRIVINECLAHGRAERRKGGIPLDDVEFLEAAIVSQAGHENPEEQLAQNQLLQLLSGEIGRTPPKLRAALLLYLQDRSTAEIAQAMGISEQAVKARLQRAREFLRIRFRRHLPGRHA
jgi:RNA polymerase sigma-70 factor, ECF subfamily